MEVSEINLEIIKSSHPYYASTLCNSSKYYKELCDYGVYDLLQIWCKPKWSVKKLRDKLPNINFSDAVKLSLAYYPIPESVGYYDRLTLFYHACKRNQPNPDTYLEGNYLANENVLFICYKYNRLDVLERLERRFVSWFEKIKFPIEDYLNSDHKYRNKFTRIMKIAYISNEMIKAISLIASGASPSLLLNNYKFSIVAQELERLTRRLSSSAISNKSILDEALSLYKAWLSNITNDISYQTYSSKFFGWSENLTNGIVKIEVLSDRLTTLNKISSMVTCLKYKMGLLYDIDLNNPNTVIDINSIQSVFGCSMMFNDEELLELFVTMSSVFDEYKEALLLYSSKPSKSDTDDKYYKFLSMLDYYIGRDKFTEIITKYIPDFDPYGIDVQMEIDTTSIESLVAYSSLAVHLPIRDNTIYTAQLRARPDLIPLYISPDKLETYYISGGHFIDYIAWSKLKIDTNMSPEFWTINKYGKYSLDKGMLSEYPEEELRGEFKMYYKLNI